MVWFLYYLKIYSKTIFQKTVKLKVMNKYINVLHSNYKKCFDYNYKNLETFKLKIKKKNLFHLKYP